MEITPNTESGLITGPSHAQGGIEFKVVETGQTVEIEGFEYKICRSARQSTKVYEFKGKTNKEILDEIHQSEGCKYIPNQANVNDFILCKLVIQDDKKRDIKGTVNEILNIMQAENSCKISEGGATMGEGGGVGSADCHACKFDGMSEFEIDLWTNYLWWMDSDNYIIKNNDQIV